MISVFLVYWFSHYITCSIWKKSETNTGLWLILPPKTTLKYDMIWSDKKDQTFKQLTFRFNSKSIPNGWSADLKRDTMKLFDCSTITVLLLTLFVWNCFFVLVREKHTHNSLFVLSGWVIPASVNQCWTIAEPIFFVPSFNMTNETLSANGYLGCLAMLDACSVSVRINKYPVLKCPFVSVCSRIYLQVGMVCTSLFWPGQSLQRRWHILSDLQLLLL